MQAAMRAAAVDFLKDYASSASIGMQVYPGRPKSINPPTGFVDAIREELDHTTNLTKRRPFADIIVIHGLFDSKNTADQKDAFVDGLIDWAESRFHQAGVNTLCAVTDTEDVPDYVPPWMPPERQQVYYATRITLEGYALIG